MDTGSQVAPVYLVREFPFFPLHLEGKVPASGELQVKCFGKGRARYRPRSRGLFGDFFCLDEVWEVELRKFSGKKKRKKNIVGIRTNAHSFDEPVQLPLPHRDTAAEFCLNNSFIIQLFLAFQVF